MARWVGFLVASRPEWRARLRNPEGGVKGRPINFSSYQYISLVQSHHPYSRSLPSTIPFPRLYPRIVSRLKMVASSVLGFPRIGELRCYRKK